MSRSCHWSDIYCHYTLSHQRSHCKNCRSLNHRSYWQSRAYNPLICHRQKKNHSSRKNCNLNHYGDNRQNDCGCQNDCHHSSHPNLLNHSFQTRPIPRSYRSCHHEKCSFLNPHNLNLCSRHGAFRPDKIHGASKT